MNFFAIFLEFLITRRAGTKRNDNFYFLSFSSFSNLFSLEMKPKWYFFSVLNFFVILLEFSISRQVGTERNDNFYFLSFSSFSNLFWLQMIPFGVFNYVSCRNGTIIFIFYLSQRFPPYFALKCSHNSIFWFFEFFCYLIGIYYYESGRNET